MANFSKELSKRFQKVQQQLQKTVQDGKFLKELKTFSEKQKKGVEHILKSDFKKATGYLQKQKKELETLKKKLPQEMKRIRKYFQTQKKELGSLLKEVKQNLKPNTKKKKTTRTRKSTVRKTQSKTSKTTPVSSI